MPLAAPRAGKLVQIKDRPLRFSYWPMYKSKRRYGLQAHLYVTNPWALIRAGILDYCAAPAREEALAYLSQARFFFDAATSSDEWAAKPLLLYYSFMNLAKSYILTRSIRSTLDQAHHGISERLRAAKRELIDAFLEAHPSPGPRGTNVFADFWQAVSGDLLAAKLELDLPKLLPQIVTGHRLWCDASGASERFMSLENIEVMQDSAAKSLWLVLHIHAGTLSQHGMPHKEMLAGALLKGTFKEVDGFADKAANETMLRFEQITPVSYTHRPSDSIPGLVNDFRHHLWAAATTTRPYREYYLYVAPAAERPQVLPQLISVYAVTFYLGSITRYRPQQFDRILASDFGAQLQEFLTSQPTQFLYLLASEFVKREITRPGLV